MADPLTKESIVQWVNQLTLSQFTCIKQIPSKAAARILNAMYGEERCPLHSISFEDSTEALRTMNASTTLNMAKRVGFSGTLTSSGWSDGDYTPILLFWRWLRAEADQLNFSPGEPLTIATMFFPVRTNVEPVPIDADAATHAANQHAQEKCARCGDISHFLLEAQSKRLEQLRQQREKLLQALRANDSRSSMYFASLATL